MESDAYKLGSLDAVLELGLTKKSSIALPLLGAAAGAALAPEDERAQGAMLGGLGMLGARAALLGRGKSIPAAVAIPPEAPIIPKSFTDVGRAAFDQGKEDLKKWFYAPPQVLQKSGSLDQFKIAVDVGGSIPIPGLGGIGMSIKDQRERLPGMSRWAPRSTIERGFDYADQGFDPESVIDLEGERGNLSSPLTGAALAAAGALKFAPKSGSGGALLAGLGGAGLGHMYQRYTRGDREREGLEALEGAQRERQRFPIRRHATQTASEATPLAISRGHGDA